MSVLGLALPFVPMFFFCTRKEVPARELDSVCFLFRPKCTFEPKKKVLICGVHFFASFNFFFWFLHQQPSEGYIGVRVRKSQIFHWLKAGPRCQEVFYFRSENSFRVVWYPFFGSQIYFRNWHKKNRFWSQICRGTCRAYWSEGAKKSKYHWLNYKEIVTRKFLYGT